MMLAAKPVFTLHTEVVVVGTGAAGLSVLTHLAQADIDTIAVTRGVVTDSSTDWAQGGLAAVFARGDSLEAHIQDTLEAGCGLCDPIAVSDLVHSAPKAIKRLISLGAHFDRRPDGELDLHLEGGHSANRIVHANGDASGAEVERTLWSTLRSALAGSKTTLLEHTRLIDVLTDSSGRACGIRMLGSKGVGDILANAVVLASGGIGQLWPITSNPPVATGDGIAAAFRAGAEIRDLEFTQFHPTVLADARASERGILISEAVRGHGAKLINADGERFMVGKHPLAELAPRDVVSAGIMAELERSGEPHVYLDARHFGAKDWQRTFPAILQMCRERGVDPVSEPIPVHPAAHYSCGGIKADLWGRTSVPGLYAVGETAATGVQGANRLASNSLTEALVSGDRLGKDLALGSHVRPGTPASRPTQSCVSAATVTTIKQAMDKYGFVTRDEDGLQRLGAVLSALPKADFSDEALTATNLAQVAAIIQQAGLARRESRGCHRRRDYPERDPRQAVRLSAQLKDGNIILKNDPLPEKPKVRCVA